MRNGRDVPSPKMSETSNRKEIFNITNENNVPKLLDSDTDIEEVEDEEEIREISRPQYTLGKLEVCLNTFILNSLQAPTHLN